MSNQRAVKVDLRFTLGGYKQVGTMDSDFAVSTDVRQ